uniref:Uncharacterized protein n=1 Tax=Acrobeloides nanus TaxID=290746 RepID=A0A914CI23_9BILA
MHHSSEYYNLTTALRKGCFQEFGTTFFECLQAFITPPPMFITHKALNLLYQFWIHNELFEFKALGWDKPRLKNSEHKDIFPGIWNKIKAVYMPPGYFPGLETKQFFWWRYMKEPSSGIPEFMGNFLCGFSICDRQFGLY